MNPYYISQLSADNWRTILLALDTAIFFEREYPDDNAQAQAKRLAQLLHVKAKLTNSDNFEAKYPNIAAIDVELPKTDGEATK